MKSASEKKIYKKKEKLLQVSLSFPFPSFLPSFISSFHSCTISYHIMLYHITLCSSLVRFIITAIRHITSPHNNPRKSHQIFHTYVRTYTRAPNPTRLDPTRPKRGVQTRVRASFSTIFQGTMTMLIFSFFLLFLPPPLLLLLLRICCTH